METLTKIMPQNVNTTVNTILDKGADISKAICGLKGLKIVWCNELTKKKKDAEVLKSIADGTAVKYTEIYKRKTQTMDIGCKLFTVSNHSIEFEADEGLKRRLRTMEFTSQFKSEFVEDNYERREFKADTDLMNKLTTEYRDAVLNLIYQYSQKYYINKKLEPYPNEWQEESNQVIDDNEGFKNWFDENCEIGEELCIHKKTLEDMFKTVLTEYKLKDEVKKFKCGIKYDSQRRETNGAKRLKGFWVGFGLKNHNMFGEEDGDQTGN
jgi:phage/plasmid-associated DNA primase